MNKRAWFVILTYRPDVVKLTHHLKAFWGHSFVLVDNSETRNDYPSWVPVIRTGRNLGYTGGMNRGIRYALQNEADWIVVTNDDLDIERSAVAKLSGLLDNIPPGVAGPFAGTLDPVRWSTICPSTNAISYISGACMAIHRNVIEKIGMFYEPYGIYYEDVELSVRAKKAGFVLTKLDIDGLVHHGSTTMRKMNTVRMFYHARNHLLFVLRNAPWRIKFHEFLRLPKTIYEYWR